MVEGLENRAVVQSARVSGQANVPSRQVAQVNVGAPRGGDVSRVGEEQRVLADLVQMGSKQLGGYLEKQQAKDELAGNLDYIANKTEAELISQGASKYRLKGFNQVKTKTAINEYQAKMSGQIDSKFFSNSPEEFNGIVRSGYGELLDGLDPEDTSTRDLLASGMNNALGQLVQQHTRAHEKYRAGESYKAVENFFYSEGGTGDAASLSEVVSQAGTMFSELSPELVQDGLFTATRRHLDEGNFSLFDELGGISGISETFNLSDAEVKGLKGSYEKAQKMAETSSFAQVAQEEQADLRDLRMGKKTLEQVLETSQSRANDLRLDATAQKGFISKAISVDSEIKQSTELQEKATDPVFVDKLGEILLDANQNGYTLSAANPRIKALAEEHGFPADKVYDFIEKGKLEGDKFNSRQEAKLNAESAKLEQSKQTDRDASVLLNTGFQDYGNASTAVRSRAFEMERQKIVEAAFTDPSLQDDEQRIQQVIDNQVDFLRTVPIKDPNLVQSFKLAGQEDPVDDNGKLRDSHSQSFRYLAAMRDAGMSESLIKEYAGESYPYFSTAYDRASGQIDPTLALQTTWDELNTSKPRPARDPEEVTEAWEDTKESFFDNIEPSVLNGISSSSNADATYDQVLTDEVTNALENSSRMDPWAKSTFRNYEKLMPNASTSAIWGMVKKDLSQWEYAMGSVIEPVGGKSLSQRMGLGDKQGHLKSHSAMLSYLVRNKDNPAITGTGNKTFFSNEVGHDTLDELLYAPEVFFGARTALNGTTPHDVLNAFDSRQALMRGFGKVEVIPTGNGKTVSFAIYNDLDKEDLAHITPAIPLKSIGTEWTTERATRQSEKNLPRRP